jgi:hypothetical protein
MRLIAAIRSLVRPSCRKNSLASPTAARCGARPRLPLRDAVGGPSPVMQQQVE